MQSRLAAQQKRNLSIHEYLSANLLKSVSDTSIFMGNNLHTTIIETGANRRHDQYGVGVPKGEVARSAAEAEAVAKSIGIPSTKKNEAIH